MCHIFPDDNPCQNYFHLFFSLLPGRITRAVLPFFDMVRRRTDKLCQHQLRVVFKELSGLILLGGPSITAFWRCFSYWEFSLGYHDYKEDDALVEDVQDWLVRDHVNGEGVGVSEYHQLIFDATYSFLHKHWRPPAEVTPIDRWLKKAAWMRGRGGTGKKTKIKLNGKLVGTRTNKGVDAKYHTDAELALELKTVYPQRIVVIQKSEAGKIRPIAKADNQLYRKMDYLGTVIEHGLRGCTRSSLFLSNRGNEQLDYHILEHLGVGINVPLDQGNFDNNQGIHVIAIVLYAVYLVCIKPMRNNELEQVWQAMWNSMFHQDSLVVLGKHRFKWGNGVASGWRWTTLLDTILNIATFDALACDIRKRLGFTYYDSVHTGDDVHFKVSSVAAAGAMLDAYRANGYAVHPRKHIFQRRVRNSYGGRLKKSVL
jgi:hypothetical protein